MDTAADYLDTLHGLQSSLVMAKFNQCRPGMSLSNFQQSGICPSGKMKDLKSPDLCRGSINRALPRFSRMPFSISDCSIMCLTPADKPALKETGQPTLIGSGLVYGSWNYRVSLNILLFLGLGL